MKLILAFVALAFFFVADADGRGCRSKGRMVSKARVVQRSSGMAKNAVKVRSACAGGQCAR